MDTRVCALLATLSAGHTVAVASFGVQQPGAGPDIPLSSVQITGIDHQSPTGASAPARALRALVAAQQPPYRPLATASLVAGVGVPALALHYSQPAPLAGLDSTTS
ncbi:hypothetical protein [Streptacidiphilus sp. PAMC 29251]